MPQHLDSLELHFLQYFDIAFLSQMAISKSMIPVAVANIPHLVLYNNAQYRMFIDHSVLSFAISTGHRKMLSRRPY